MLLGTPWTSPRARSTQPADGVAEPQRHFRTPARGGTCERTQLGAEPSEGTGAGRLLLGNGRLAGLGWPWFSCEDSQIIK